MDFRARTFARERNLNFRLSSYESERPLIFQIFISLGEKDSYNDTRETRSVEAVAICSPIIFVRLIDIRLVNRRIEQRQEHNITRTEITQRWLTCINHAVTHAEINRARAINFIEFNRTNFLECDLFWNIFHIVQIYIYAFCESYRRINSNNISFAKSHFARQRSSDNFLGLR